MSRPNQLDLHPDAESLNAYIEHLLGDEEREQLLAHMATCSRCRQVVYLARGAAYEAENSIQKALPKKEKRLPGNWFANWRPVRMAAACACVAILALWLSLRLRHAPIQDLSKAATPPAGSSATVSSPRPAVQEESTSHPPAMLESSRRRTEYPHPLHPSEALESNVRAAQSTAISGSTAQPSPQPLDSVTQTVAVQPEGLDEAARPASTEVIPAQPIVSLNQQAIPGKNRLALAAPSQHVQGLMQSARANAVVAGTLQAQSSKPAQPSQTVSVTGESSAMISNSALAASLPSNAGNVGIDALSAEDLATARDAMHAILPSGQTPVSTASAQQRLLAIDNAGALFLSNDNGKTWELVAPQWTGHIVTLRAHPIVSGVASSRALGEQTKEAAEPSSTAATTGAANGAVVRGPMAQPAPAAFFEIVNDSGSIWTSFNGKVWAPK
jgi:hypothetical protein